MGIAIVGDRCTGKSVSVAEIAMEDRIGVGEPSWSNLDIYGRLEIADEIVRAESRPEAADIGIHTRDMAYINGNPYYGHSTAKISTGRFAP